MIEKGLVIGVDGLAGVGKSTAATKLAKKYKEVIHIEMGKIYNVVGKWYIFLKQNGYTNKDTIDFIKRYLKCNYKVVGGREVEFQSVIPVPTLTVSDFYVKMNLYKVIEDKEICDGIRKILRKTIDELKGTYTIVLTGRLLEEVYPNLDYHFYLRADQAVRNARVMVRDNITEKDVKKRNEKEKRYNFSPNVISVSSDRLNEKEIIQFIENVISTTQKRDKIIKVHFFGSASTGKSTMCKLCGERFNEPYILEIIKEYMRENGLGEDFPLSYEMFYDMAKRQLKIEKQAEKIAKKYVFTDSGAMTYALLLHYLDRPEMVKLIDQQLEEAEVIFLCDNDLGYAQDGIRKSDPTVYKDLQQDLINYMNQRKVPYVVLNGPIEERFKTVQQILKKY